MGSSSSKTSGPALQHVANCDTSKFMGTWFVIAVKPTAFETTNSNAVEKYSRTPDKKYDVFIDFQYNKKEPITSSLTSLNQRGWIQGDNKDNSGLWNVCPNFLPKFAKMPYLILEVDDDYSYTVIGYPSRAYAWIMYRHPTMPDALYDSLTTKLKENHQYDLTGMRKVPQVWTREEREKRGLTKKEIPESMLSESSK